MDRYVVYEFGMDDGIYSYGFDVEGSDCFESASRLLQGLCEIVLKIFQRPFPDCFETVLRLFQNAATRYAFDRGFCTSCPLP